MHAVRLIPIAAFLMMIGFGTLPAATSCARRESIDDFQLPPKTAFDRTMPRYPNVWFLVDTALAPSHRDAVKLVTDGLRDSMRLREYFPPFDNPEGCDFEARIEHLQPWEDRTARALQHAHAFHLRYYYSALAANQLEKVTLNSGDLKGTFYRFAASVHYEVEHSNPNHADVEACPICGRTGEYRDLRGNLVELVHDPLGLELLLSGTIRDQRVRFEDYGQREVGSIAALGDQIQDQLARFSRHDRRSEYAPDWCGDNPRAVRVRPEIAVSFWASRRPPGKARGARIPGVCKRRATQPGGMHRRPEWHSYFRTGPKSRGAIHSIERS